MSYENDRLVHKSQSARGAGRARGRGQRVFGCTAAHSLHNGCWKEEKANNFQARRVQQKNMRKKFIKIREIGESQGKRPRKDVKAPAVSFAPIKEIVTVFLN